MSDAVDPTTILSGTHRPMISVLPNFSDGKTNTSLMPRRKSASRLWISVFTPILNLVVMTTTSACAADRPNIVWIIVDDMSANFSCYGETAIRTPNVDQLAAEGVRFTNAYVTAPVCSTCRSAFITGMYQTSLGSHHHRSGRGEQKISLPENVVLVPELFQNAGYHTSLGGWPTTRKGRLGKTDYNFEWDESIYDGNDWATRKPDQPFFHQIQTPGGKRRGNSDSARKFQKRCAEIFGSATPVSQVTLPPYYPTDPVLLEDWAAYLDCCRYTDRLVGEVVERLRKEGQLDNTILLFMTDHGISHARGKQFLYDEGIHVPLVIRGPGIAPGVTRSDLVEHIDISALSLSLAGIKVPDNMQGRDILSPEYQPRHAVFSARDRCDETVDHLRSVRTHQYKYIRNFLPERPHLQPCAYKDKKSILIALRAANEAGTLTDLQRQLLFSATRAAEELYDLQKDPHELSNLASSPGHRKTLEGLRERLEAWMEETGDVGREPEPAAMYNSDMKIYVDTLKARKQAPEHIQRIEDNIALMKKWAAAGK